jgi:zinc protease
MPLLRRLRTMALALLLPATAFLVAAPAPALADGATTYTEVKSPGGIAFLHRFDDTTPYAAVNFGWRDHYGALAKDKAGLPGLVGSMLMRGADSTGENGFVERLNDLAAVASFGGSTYQFRGSVKAPGANLAEAMQLTAAALKTAAPSDKVFRRLLQQSTEGEAAATTRSETIAQRAALQLALGDHPTVWAFSPSRFANATPADAGPWRKATLDRAGLKVVVSGKVSAADAGAMLDAAFADLPEKAASPKAQLPLVAALKPRTIVIERPTGQSAIVITGRADVPNGPPGQLAGVANRSLGGGSDGRIWQAVRAGLGASYGGSSSLQMADPDQRLLQMTATVANEQVAASLLAMRKTYATWVTDGVTEAEFKSSVSNAVNFAAGLFKDPAGANNTALNMLMSDRPITDLHGYTALMQALTVPDINDMIRNKFPKPDQLMTVIVTPSAARLVEAGITADCVIRTLEELDRCKR